VNKELSFEDADIEDASQGKLLIGMVQDMREKSYHGAYQIVEAFYWDGIAIPFVSDSDTATFSFESLKFWWPHKATTSASNIFQRTRLSVKKSTVPY
jgi:hypothetical protein